MQKIKPLRGIGVVEQVQNRDIGNMFYEIPVPNFEKIKAHVLQNFNTFYPWNDDEPGYSGYGLTHDPEYPVEPPRQVLGPVSGLFDEYQKSERFCHFTCDDSKILFDLVGLPYTPIRSRIAVIDGGTVNSRSAWHIDEPLMKCLRVNIPIVTNPFFHLQTETMQVTPREGYSYIWDTSKLHRAYCSKKNDTHRINLVLGFIPTQDESWCKEAVTALIP